MSETTIKGVVHALVSAVCANALVTRTLGVVEALIKRRLTVRTDTATQQAAAVVGEGCLALAAATSSAGR